MKSRSRQSIVVLTSGGVESCILLRYFSRAGTVYPLYMRSGYIWEKAELHHLRRFLARTRHPNIRPLSVLDFPLRDIQPSHWGITGRGIPDARSEDREVELPGRNTFLLSLAAAFASSRGVCRVALGTLSSNPFADATPAFFGLARRLLGQALGTRIQILTPFSHLKKSQVIERYGKRLPLHLTFSCLNPSREGRVQRAPTRRGGLQPPFLPCGDCNKCAERQSALGVS